MSSNKKTIINLICSLMAVSYTHLDVYKRQRLDEMQAAFLSVKLLHLNRMNQERKRIASRYINEIKNPSIVLPHVIEGAEPVWHIFAVRSDLSLIHI